MEKLKILRHFIGRKDVFLIFDSKDIRKEKWLKDKHLLNHLKGIYQVGVFPNPYSLSNFLCLDCDTDDQEPILNLCKEMDELGFQVLPEWTGHFFHIWIVFRNKIPNFFLRKFGQLVLRDTEISSKVEIFPKQDIITEYGNALVLPLGKHRKTQNFSHFIDWATLEILEDKEIFKFLYNPIENLEKVLNKNGYVLFYEPCFNRIYQEGVSEGLRNYMCYQLAIRLKEKGIDKDQSFEFLRLWIGRCEKFTHPFTLREVEKIIFNVFSGKYIDKKIKCKNPKLEKFCIGKEVCYFYCQLKRRSKWKKNL